MASKIKDFDINKSNIFVDVTKLNTLDIIKELDNLFFNLFGLKLSFYPVTESNIDDFLKSEELDKLISSSTGKTKSKKEISSDIKKAVDKKELVVYDSSPSIRRLIMPVMVKRKVYGIAISSEIDSNKKNSDSELIQVKQQKAKQSKSHKDSQGVMILAHNELKQVGDFLKSFVNYVFMSKFEEVIFLNSELAQTHIQEAMVKAVGYIKENYYKPNLSLSEASEAVNLSPYYFSHQFKREYDTTFIEYLTKVRLDSAIKLLKDLRLNVAQISFAVGYQDPNYFSKVFRKCIDISPHEYREQFIGQKAS